MSSSNHKKERIIIMMELQVENSIWHAFDYLSMENGKQSANRSKLKVSITKVESILNSRKSDIIFSS